MKQIVIKPVKGALDGVPKEHLQKWFDALQTSVKHKNSMCNSENTAHCCLCVSAQLEGAGVDHYGRAGRAGDLWAPITHSFQCNAVAFAEEVGHFAFNNLNDGILMRGNYIELTHPQIAEIIMGREVVLEIKS